MDTTPSVTVGAKRTIEYLLQALSLFNRGSDEVELLGVGACTSKAAALTQLLARHFQTELSSVGLSQLERNGVPTTCTTFRLRRPPAGAPRDPGGRPEPLSRSVPYHVYHLLVDHLLACEGELTLSVTAEDHRVLKVHTDPIAFTCSRTDWLEEVIASNRAEKNRSANDRARAESDHLLNDLAAALYRAGLILSPRWREVAAKLAEFDDVILGLDTNLLYDCVVTQQLLDGFAFVNRAEYSHTPNWLLLILPSAVMHEIEQAANARSDRGELSVIGRLGYRAIQEILEIDQSNDLGGVSLLIVGEANPILDNRVELRGLREDFKRAQPPDVRGSLYRKLSAGDTLIRDQFKAFLRQISFHKGAYFLTGDKSNSALAKAEGLHSLYYPPTSTFALLQQGKKFGYPSVSFDSQSLPLPPPLGKLIYELAVQFRSVTIAWDRGQVQLSCDTRGDSLGRWLNRELAISHRDAKTLLATYKGASLIPLTPTTQVCTSLGGSAEAWD